MFSCGEDCVIKLHVKWSELLSQRSMTSEAVRVHGLDWFLHLDIIPPPNSLYLCVGFKQIPEATVSCATQIRYVIDSMDPNGARYTMTQAAVALCHKSKRTEWNVNQIEEYILNDGWLTVFAQLHIFKPVRFSRIPSHFSYSFLAPPARCIPVAERNGLIYLLVKHSTGWVQPIWWAVQCMRAFDKDTAVTLGFVQIQREDFILGTSINIETKQIAVTQLVEDEEENEYVRLDVIDLSGGAQRTRIYQTPPQNEHSFDRITWSAAVITSQGWIMADNVGVFDADGISVRFRFWLLADQMTLLTQVARYYTPKFALLSQLIGISYNTLYCAFISPARQWHFAVCELDHPTVWKEYEICPAPGVANFKLLLVWPEPVLAAHLSTGQGTTYVLYRLQFNTTDCLLVPFLSLPHDLAIDFDDRNFCFNPDSLLRFDLKWTLDVARHELMLLRFTVPRLKTLALFKVQRMLTELMRMDDQQHTWTLWKDKLEKIIGRNTLAYILDTQSSTCT